MPSASASFFGSGRSASVLGRPDFAGKVHSTALELVKRLGRDDAFQEARSRAGHCPDPWNFWYQVHLAVWDIDDR